jgi:hypothetical protein
MNSAAWTAGQALPDQAFSKENPFNRSVIFGFVNSAIVDRPSVFFALIIDLDKTPIPLNLIVIIVRVALDRSNKHGVDANDGRQHRNENDLA